MLISLDGKVVGDYLKVERAAYFTEEYEKIHGLYGCKAWMCGRVTMEEHRSKDHIIEVLTEQVSDAYLTHLKKIGISYIFGGKERLNFSLVVEKLKNLFSIDKLMLEGGGFLNGSILNEGLIDELSLILVPIVDGTSNSVTLFETSSYLNHTQPLNFHLKEVGKLNDGGLWMKPLRQKREGK
jgi:riboflavin biosynthesis pyrimidine reductase